MPFDYSSFFSGLEGLGNTIATDVRGSPAYPVYSPAGEVIPSGSMVVPSASSSEMMTVLLIGGVAVVVLLMLRKRG